MLGGVICISHRKMQKILNFVLHFANNKKIIIEIQWVLIGFSSVALCLVTYHFTTTLGMHASSPLQKGDRGIYQ